MTKRKTIYMFVDELVPATRNAKAHAAPEIKQSIVTFGFVDNVINDGRTGRMIAGHGRLEALAELEGEGAVLPEGIALRAGRWQAPVTTGWSSVDDLEAEALAVALNRTPILGGFHNEPLLATLEDLRARPDLFAAAGFDDAAFDMLKARAAAVAAEAPTRDTGEHLRPPKKAFTKRGDVWLLGPHRIMCGDCRVPADVEIALDGATINLAVTSPPYAEQRDYDEDSGFVPIPPDAYVDWFAPVAGNVEAHLADDGSWFVNIKPPGVDLDTHLYVFDLVVAHVRAWGWHFATEFCWERNGVPKHVTLRFKNQFEPVYQFTRGRWKMRPENVRHFSDNAISPLGPDSGVDTGWKDKQGEHGVIPQREKKLPRGDIANWQGGTGPGAVKKRGDVTGNAGLQGTSRAERGSRIDGPDGRRGKRARPGNSHTGSTAAAQGTNWEPGEAIGPGLAFPGNRLPTFSGSHEAVGHAAAFPVGLPAWFVRAYTDPGDVVFDPFAGSGSTILAADQEGRVGVGVELSPAYVDLICARYQRATGIVPIRLATGKPRDFSNLWKIRK